MSSVIFADAEIFDMPPFKWLGEPEFEGRSFCVQFDGVWVKRGFKRRCDAGRWARLRALNVRHWYTI